MRRTSAIRTTKIANKRPSAQSDISDKEAWDTPIVCTAITNKPVYQDTPIPLFATSYDLPLREKLFQRLRKKLKRKIKRSVIKPLFRRETVSKVVWRSDLESTAAFLALAFSACILIRFPYACARFGGGLFFLVYVLIVLFVMQPTIFTLVILGRVTSSGLAKYPLFYLCSKGIPLVMLYMTMVFVTNNNIVLGYSGVYVLAQLLDTPPDVCTTRMKRHSDCTPYKDANPFAHTKFALPPNNYLSTDLFFSHYVQGDRWKQHKWFFFSVREWRFFFGMTLVFLIVFLAIYKNIVSPISRILIYGTFVLPTCLVCLTAFQLVFEGGIVGMMYQFLGFKWHYLLTVEVWQFFETLEVSFWSEAWGFAFCSCFPGYGLLTSFGNYKTSLKGVYFLTWMMCLAIIIFSGLSMCLVATEMGILENHGNIQSYFDSVSEQSALSYICLTNVLMKIPTVWPSVIFFAYVTVFGLWTQVVATEVCIHYVFHFCSESYPSLGLSHSNRVQVILGIILVEMLLIMAYGSQAGPFMFEAHFIFGGSWAACIISIIRIYTATRFYGYDVFQLRLELLTMQAPPRYFEIQIRYIVLPLLGVGFILLTVGMFFLEYLSYQTSHPPTDIALFYGWTLNIIPLGILLLYIVRAKGCKRNEVRPSVHMGAKIHDSISNTQNRLLTRRNAVYIANEELVEPDRYDMEKKLALEEEANAVYHIQALQKIELKNLLRIKKAQSKWKGTIANAFLSSGLVRNFPDAVKYFTKRTAADIAKKDAAYLERTLRTYSVDNVFVAAQVASSRSKTSSETRLRYDLMHNLLLDQRDLEKNLPTREASRNKFWTEMVEPPIRESVLTKVYADHIEQELGEPYGSQCKWECPDEFVHEKLAQRIEDSEATGHVVEPIEYVVRYRQKNKLERVVHVLVIEGKRHPILMRLPDPEPPSVTISHQVLDSKPEKEKFRLICGKALLHLHKNHKDFFNETDSATVRPDDLRPNKYIDMIANHFGKGNFGFLNPKKVCIVIIEKKEDAEFVRLESQFVNPLEGKGWLLKPSRRKLRKEKRIERIKALLLSNHNDTVLTTYQQMRSENELIELRDQLTQTLPDIIFKANDDSDEPVYAEPDSDSSDSSIFDVLRPKPSNLEQIKDSTDRTSSENELEIKAKDDEDFHKFLVFIKDWKNPNRRDLHQEVKYTQEANAVQSNNTKAGRRHLYQTVLTNLESQKVNMFPMGSLPMKVVREGPSPPSVNLSNLSLPSLEFTSEKVQKRKLEKGIRFDGFESEGSVTTLWSQVPSDTDDDGIKSIKSFHHKSIAMLIEDKRKDNNSDYRYIYREIGNYRLEIELKDENFVMAGSSDSIGKPHLHRSLFNLFHTD